MSEAIKRYILVAKPGIVLGNLVTAAGGFLLASKGRFDTVVLLSTVIGISLIVASACVINNCVDRNMDRKMTRTCNRALARGLMSPKAAIFHASWLSIAGTTLLLAATNLLSVAIVLIGFGIYAGLYSLYLKRNSVYGTLIGSLAGTAPPLAGYCAVSNRFDMGAVILLSIFSLWQMPHFYSIAVFRFNDYLAAGVPALPVKQGTPAARKHIFCYILAFTAATPMLTLAGYTGYSTLAVAAAFGLSWLYMAWRGYKTYDNRLWAKRLFIFSILNLFVLSVMMSIDFTASAASRIFLTCAP